MRKVGDFGGVDDYSVEDPRRIQDLRTSRLAPRPHSAGSAHLSLPYAHVNRHAEVRAIHGVDVVGQRVLLRQQEELERGDGQVRDDGDHDSRVADPARPARFVAAVASVGEEAQDQPADHEEGADDIQYILAQRNRLRSLIAETGADAGPGERPELGARRGTRDAIGDGPVRERQAEKEGRQEQGG